MARVYPIRVGNTEGDQTENRALFTLLSDRTQGYKFLYNDMEVRSPFLRPVVAVVLIDNVRDGVGGSPMNCSPRAGRNFLFLADHP